MKEDTRAPIPIPLKERWRDVRMRLLPGVVFAAAVVAIGLLWHDQVGGPTLVGQAEPLVANVNSFKPGMLAELSVTRFQKVKAGDVVGRIIVANPQVLASSLAVIQSEIELLRVDLRSTTTKQRAAINFTQLQLDWMKQRAQLATSQVNSQLAETELQRTEELFKSKISSQQAVDQARAMRDALRGEVAELTKLVAGGERSLSSLQYSNSTEIGEITDAPLRAAIAVQESKLRLTEAELSPVVLTAPMDGMVNMVYCRAGEAVTAGQPIVGIASFNAVRIVGYMRPPILHEPRPAMTVEVRTRGWRRQVGQGQVIDVGAQWETIPPALLGPFKLAAAEPGLPLNISVPPNLNIRPGELVDIAVSPKAN